MEGRGVGLGEETDQDNDDSCNMVYATISTEYRAVVVIKLFMTMPIAPMRARVGSLNTNLGSTRTAKMVKMNGLC